MQTAILSKCITTSLPICKYRFGGIDMWNYTCVTRRQFEAVKDKAEEFIVSLGGRKADIALPYAQKTVSIASGNKTVHISARPPFEYNGQYYRVNEICFSEKPFLVIECGSYDELMKNAMEDADPFPYDLSDEELLNEVKYSLGIAPDPEVR